MIEPVGGPHEEVTPDMRVSIALALRDLLDQWRAADLSRDTEATFIWNNLLAADTTDDDADADDALRDASRRMILNGALTSKEYDDLVEKVRSEQI